MSLVLSTSWNAFRFDDAKSLLFEIKQTGFRELELSFNLTRPMVEGIAKSAGFTVRSLHNFCPIPDEVPRQLALPDCYSMAATDSEERALAVKNTKRTIDTAKKLGAEAVVLHCGRVEIADRTRDLIEMYEKGLSNTQEFNELKSSIIKERVNLIGPFFENTLASLKELNQHAQKQGISLGVENRFYYREIPTLEEIGIILDKFKDSRVFYWHDTGHAQVMQNLGLAEHRRFLDLYADRMLGIHLHDLRGCQDHMAPGEGQFDFSFLCPYLKNNIIKVVEAHDPATALDIKRSKSFLEGLYGGCI